MTKSEKLQLGTLKIPPSVLRNLKVGCVIYKIRLNVFISIVQGDLKKTLSSGHCFSDLCLSWQFFYPNKLQIKVKETQCWRADIIVHILFFSLYLQPFSPTKLSFFLKSMISGRKINILWKFSFKAASLFLFCSDFSFFKTERFTIYDGFGKLV